MTTTTKTRSYYETFSLWANGTLSAEARVRKLSGRWFVADAERPDELLHGPTFKTKREAMAYAEDNMRAVLTRLREGVNGE